MNSFSLELLSHENHNPPEYYSSREKTTFNFGRNHNFRSLHLGRALLFKRVVNLTYTHIQDRVMLTGRHMVRDVMCKNCKTKLGWMYEYATEDSQK